MVNELLCELILLIYMKKPITLIILIAAFGGILLQPIQAQVRKKPSPAPSPIRPNTFNPNKWLGTWEKRSWLQDGNFQVQYVSGNALTFDLSATSGSLPWEAKGHAYLKDNYTAVFSSPLYAGCKITMHMLSDSVVQIDGSPCEAYGKKVNYTGRFVNNKYLPERKQQTMLSLRILNKQQDAAFRKLVSEEYISFVNLTQRITEYKPQKTGGNNVRIFSAKRDGVEGLTEYIMMIDNANHIWAALLVGGYQILYYTNTPGKKTLPQPIEQWRSRLPKKYPVIYQKQ